MKDVSIKDVFISYRHNGGQIMAHHLCHWLINDGYTVFLDVQLRSGRFDKALYKRIEECTDFLLVVSPNGFDRCNDREDWVRLEIEHALLCGKNIIPVIMPGCKIPEVLPESIQEIKNHKGYQFVFNLEEAEFKNLEQEFMQSKPRVTIAELDISEIERPSSHKEDMPLHEQMSQKAFQDTKDHAENHITAINAAQGNAEAQFQLAMIYHSRYLEGDHSPITIVEKEMMYWLKLAVAQNHPKAICHMGKCYYHGFGVEQNPAKAVIFYRKSLEYDKNLTEAMWSLGDCYLNGIGVESSVVQAANLYKQAMEAGDIYATKKYIELVYTADAVKKLNGVSVVKKIKSVIEKKESENLFSRAFQLMAICQMGVVRYGSLRRLRLLDDQGHTMDQIGEERLQKYQGFMNKGSDLILPIMVLFTSLMYWAITSGEPSVSIASTFSEFRELLAEIEISDSVREFLVMTISEIRNLFAGINIPDSIMTVLVSIGEWVVSLLELVVLPLLGDGVLFGIYMYGIETHRDPETEYWNLGKKVCKFLGRCAVFVLIYRLGGCFFAFLAMILYLILPHKLLKK